MHATAKVQGAPLIGGQEHTPAVATFAEREGERARIRGLFSVRVWLRVWGVSRVRGLFSVCVDVCAIVCLGGWGCGPARAYVSSYSPPEIFPHFVPTSSHAHSRGSPAQVAGIASAQGRAGNKRSARMR